MKTFSDAVLICSLDKPENECFRSVLTSDLRYFGCYYYFCLVWGDILSQLNFRRVQTCLKS